MTNSQRWRKLLAWLQREFPARYPVTVRSVERVDAGAPGGPYDGAAELVRGRFLIEIRRRAVFAVRVDAVLHEWAHALTWQGAEADEDHSSEWGIAYARVYREYLKWNWGKWGSNE